MTYGGYHCMHEGLNGCHTMKEYKAKLDVVSGDANTGLVMCNFRKHFPTNRTVIIDSDITASVAYGIKHLYKDYTESMLNMKAKLDAVHGLHIAVADITEKLPVIWAYLTHDDVYNEERADLLNGLNIQVNQPYVYDIPAAKDIYNDSK